MYSMANRVLRNLLGECCNLYTGFEDQLETLDVLEIWNDLHDVNMTWPYESPFPPHAELGHEKNVSLTHIFE